MDFLSGVFAGNCVRRNERSFAAAAVKRPDDGRAQRPFTTTDGAFHAAIALTCSMFTQDSGPNPHIPSTRTASSWPGQGGVVHMMKRSGSSLMVRN